jgi:hypothetical protein
MLEECKIQNDMPFVQNRDSESWTWKEQRPAVEVPAVREKVL